MRKLLVGVALLMAALSGAAILKAWSGSQYECSATPPRKQKKIDSNFRVNTVRAFETEIVDMRGIVHRGHLVILNLQTDSTANNDTTIWEISSTTTSWTFDTLTYYASVPVDENLVTSSEWCAANAAIAEYFLRSQGELYKNHDLAIYVDPKKSEFGKEKKHCEGKYRRIRNDDRNTWRCDPWIMKQYDDKYWLSGNCTFEMPWFN